MGFIWFRRVCTALLCALLAVLFTVPGRYLDAQSAAWNDAIDAAGAALRAGDYQRAGTNADALVSSFAEAKPALERFLHHDAVEGVFAALMEAEVLCAAHDAPGALAALAAAKGGIEHLLCIERFTWNALL